MKLWEIFRFEVAYQARRPWPWLFFAVLLGLSFLVTRDASLSEALYEDFFVNSPFSIAKTTVVGGLIWLLVAAAVAGEAAARDVATRMHPLTYTLPVTKAEYLGGRFLAALVINAVLLLAVQAGIVLAIYTPGVAPEAIGPFRPAAFLTAYGFLALPNCFAATAIQFSLAARSGRAMASYLGSLLLFFLAFFIASILLFRQGVGALLDPIGVRFVLDEMSHLWTTTEKSWRLIALEGTVLGNRLVWLGVGAGVLALTYLGFRFAHRTERTPWWRRRRRVVEAPEPLGIGARAGAPISVPHVARPFGLAFHARQTLAIAGDSFRAIATSWAGIALLVFIPLLTIPVVLDQMTSMGAPLVPTTARVLRELTAPLGAELSRWVIVPLLIAFFAGELVWRERDAGMGEITDAVPGSEWAPFLGKLLGLGLVLALLMALLTAAGMLAQMSMGHADFQLGLYLRVLFGLQLPEYLLFALLALAVHVVVDQKYVGHLLAILAYVYIAMLAGMLGIEHNLLVYGAGPGWSYTEMRGFGPTLGPWAWFKAYWAAWALLLAVMARLLWVRGREGGLGTRLRLARRRLTRATAGIGAAAALLVLALGGFIFYNTNVRNEYLSSADAEERSAEYERRYRRYENAPQPRLAGTRLRVEIHPDRRAAEVRGSYRLVNAGTAPIDTIHVATAAKGVETRAITFDRPAALKVDDETLGHRIYALARPLQPGDTLRLDFEVRVRRHGFGNRGVDASVVENGSYFTNAWLPLIGYQRQRELISASDRRAHGLQPRPVIASLYDTEAREPATRGGGIAFEAVVGTDEGQVAVAPGALRRTWTEGGRRYFHYATDAPIGGEWAFFSARYAVREARWNDVVIRIYHHPAHTGHLERTLRSARASLDYYTRQFGPYPYRHLTIVEQAGGVGAGLHAEPSMISHGEGFPYWIPKDDPGSLDVPYAVVAHEMAHQWTLPYALVEGAPFLSEGLAWYSALQVVKASRGEEQLRRLLTWMREPYPFAPIRRGEPLLRALDPYLSYRRGPFAMYALSEYVGAERVNGALRRLIETHDAPGAPRATTLDLYRELQAVTPDSLRYLLHDLFEVNTYWELKTERATAEEAGGGAWRVTLDVRARKVAYDSAGVETEARMDEWIPVGVFGAPGSGGDALSAPLQVRLHRIRSGAQTITVTVPGKPVRAGIDPYHLLDWESPAADDNVVEVKVGSGGDAPRPAP